MQTSGKSTPRKLTLPTGRVVVVASRWNEGVTTRLVQGARAALEEIGVSNSLIDEKWVSGAFELPQAAQALANTGKYAAIVPIGCLIRGETSHFNWISKTVVSALDQVGRATGVAVSLGLLTCETMDQAMSRSGGKHGNKGAEAAYAAVELAQFLSESKG